MDICFKCKTFINDGLDSELKEYVNFLIKNAKNYQIPTEYVFQQVYIHACLKQRPELAQWLKDNVYELYLDDIQKIGIRQTFSYGKYLLNKK
jgi:hypothetical protein